MATTYETVYSTFLSKVSDYDLCAIHPDETREYLYDLMNSAITRFEGVCVTDLSVRDEENKSFLNDLSYLEIDIISEMMIENWLKPKLYNSDLLRNNLSTKDFSVFSPANLANSTRETYVLAHNRSESLINKYSFTMNNVRELNNYHLKY